MENGVVNVARGLDPVEFDLYAACIERKGAFAARFPDPDHVFVLGKKSGFSPRAVWRLRRMIRRIGPDVVHTHNLGPLIYAALATGFGSLRPILHGEHASLTEEDCTPRRLMQRRILYRCCVRVHTVTQALSDHLMEHGFPASKITTIMNGVDTVRFISGDRCEARRLTELPDDAVVVGIVGRFGPFKRHAMLIEAFSALGPEHPDLHLLMVGCGGSEEAKIREMARRHPHADRIHLAGFQDNPVPWYQSMDLLVVPSVNEGLSNAVLEAMSCGVPVLANDACGNSDVISSGRDGFVADLGTVDKLSGQLSRRLADPAVLAAAGSEARRKAAAAFSIDRMLAGYAGLYRATAGGNSR